MRPVCVRIKSDQEEGGGIEHKLLIIIHQRPKKNIHNGGCILEYCPQVAVDSAGTLLHLCRHHEDWPIPQQGAAQRLGNGEVTQNIELID